MIRRRIILLRITFIIVFVVTSFILNLNLGLYLLFSTSYISIIISFLAVILFISLAYDFSELIVASIFKPYYPEKLLQLSNSPKVAILYTTRHDAREECLESLSKLTYKSCDVFILDDSDDNRQTALFKRFNFSVSRRNTREGFKAGNINSWLAQQGRYYPYFIIADSDSKLPPNFVEEMLKYAEHPNNQEIAIFQSNILPWNDDESFAKNIGFGTIVRMYTTNRTCNALNSLLSYGHNNLHRTNIVLSLGGFDESLTPEDTTISLKLSEFGFHCQMVNVVSYDAEPSNLSTYLRRSSRWCQQTIEVLSRRWSKADFGLKIAVHRSFISYLLILFYPALFLVTMIQPKVDMGIVINSLNYFIWAGRYDILFIWVFPLIVLAANICLNSWFAHRSGILIKQYLLHVILSIAITYCSVPKIAGAIRRQILRKKVIFNPTNEKLLKFSKPSILLDIISLSWFPVGLAILVVIVSIIFPANLIIYFNFIWLFAAFLSPVIIWFTKIYSPNDKFKLDHVSDK